MAHSPRRVRVLVADREVGMRRALASALDGAKGVDFLGTASLGTTMLAKVESLGPEIVIVDAELSDGGPALWRRLRASHPTLRIVVLGGRAALGSADHGAQHNVDFLPRPSGAPEQLASKLSELLIPLLDAAFARSHARLEASAPPLGGSRGPSQPTDLPSLREPAGPFDAVVLASSTGGPRALDAVLPLLPLLPVPILIVQHMPPEFTRALAERLATACSFPVREATDGEALSPRGAWVAPGGSHLAVVKRGRQYVTSVHQGPPENSCRPAADVLFRSAVAAWGGRVLGVVLTGMGQDGLKGARQIVDAGGAMIVQDEATSVVWGMPGFIAQAGLAQAVLPLSHIAQAVTSRVLPGARLESKLARSAP